jgi:hypothetical protein
LEAYGKLSDSNLLALATMNEVLIGLAEFADQVENSEIKKYIDQI